jgi:integrase
MTGSRKDNLESWISETPNARGYFEAFVWMGTKPNGKPDRRHVQRTTLAAVRRRVRELERKRDAGTVGKPGRVPTIEQMLTRHLDVVLPQRGRAPRTIDDYRSKCRNDIFPRWGGQRIDRLLPEQIEDGYAEMLAAGHAASHVVKVHAILSSLYEIAVKRGHVARNPCKLVEPPMLGQPDYPALTRAQVHAVLSAAAERRNSARWSVGLACGLRQGEALGLRWEYLIGQCLDCERTFPAVECWADRDGMRCPACSAGCVIEARVWFQLQRLTWRHGCKDVAACTQDLHKRPCPRKCPKAARTSGRRHVCAKAGDPGICPADCTAHARNCPDRIGGGLVLREIKERRQKTVPLAPELAVMLRAHWIAQRAERLAAANVWEDRDLVFCQADGRPIDPRGDWEEWAAILQAAGVPHHGVHAARHSAATVAIDEGVALTLVQEMLGHSDIRVTRGYVHTASPLARDAASRMGRALFGAPDPAPTATKTATKRRAK